MPVRCPSDRVGEAYPARLHVYVGHALKELVDVEDKARTMFTSGDTPPVMRFRRAEAMFELDLDVEGPLQATVDHVDEW